GGGVHEQGAVALGGGALGRAQRGEGGQGRPVHEQRYGALARAGGHVLPGDLGDGAVAGGVPGGERRYREEDGEQCGKPLTHGDCTLMRQAGFEPTTFGSGGTRRRRSPTLI